jgi:2,3-bisphosphoglycerate-dependent phosphoglycerate mutase
MVTITFEPHATTEDNEKKLASGWYDVQLSALGRQQAKELGERYKSEQVDAVFCSDLGRAVQTAAIAFGGDPLNADPHIIFIDWRLRECHYGDFTRKSSELVETEKALRINNPFPNGESYEQVAARMKSFIEDLKQNWNGKNVLVIGHRGTHYSLGHFIKGMPLNKAVLQKFTWQPGWQYQLQ